MYSKSQMIKNDSGVLAEKESATDEAIVVGSVSAAAKMRSTSGMAEGSAVPTEEKAMAGGGGDETGGQEVQMRENLEETAFFYPALLTDKDGSVALSFTLPAASRRGGS